MTDPAAPIACTLNEAGAGDQLRRWAELGPFLRRANRTDEGAEFWFDPTARSSVAAVAEREAACCGFLSLSLADDGGSLRLDVRATCEDGAAVAHLLVDQVEHGATA
jgi:hypothetical protein